MLPDIKRIQSINATARRYRDVGQARHIAMFALDDFGRECEHVGGWCEDCERLTTRTTSTGVHICPRCRGEVKHFLVAVPKA